jgi:hypothetical protein
MTNVAPEWMKAFAASADPAFSHPDVSTPPVVPDGIAAYRQQHPGALDTTTPPPLGAGPGGPVTVSPAEAARTVANEAAKTPAWAAAEERRFRERLEAARKATK